MYCIYSVQAASPAALFAPSLAQVADGDDNQQQTVSQPATGSKLKPVPVTPIGAQLVSVG